MSRSLLMALVTCFLPFASVFAECTTTDPCAPQPIKDAWQKSVAIGFNLTSGNSDNTLATVIGAANSELGIEAAISSQLALVVSIKDLYDNVPAAGRERNDVQVISALKISL